MGRRRSAGMAAAERPEWLPEGWTAKVAAADGGAEGLVYTCLVSGCKFSSKEEVMNYLRNEKNADHVSRSTSCGDTNNDSLDWLPPGWIIEFKTRKEGATSGRQDKIFIDPLTKAKFYSKRQVCLYLQSVNSCSPTSKKDVNVDSGNNASTLTNRKSRVNTRSFNNSVNSCGPTTKKDVIVDSDGTASTLTNQQRIVDAKSTDNVGAQTESTVNELPPGWIKEVRYRKNGRGKDPYYIDPVSGYEFRSLKDAFCYLSCGDVNECATKPRKRSINDTYAFRKESHNRSSCSPATKNVIANSDDNASTLTNQQRKVDLKSTDDVGAETESSVNGLPPGWIKEVRHRKKGHGKDPYYIDPVSGYEFRSLKDAYRYLSCGDVNKCAMKPRKRSINDADSFGKESPNGSSCSPTTKNVIVNSDDHTSTLTNQQRTVDSKSTDNVGAEIGSSVNGLPPGWIKEVRCRKTGHGKDPYYIDPVSGYEFRSLKDAYRYLSCGDVNKCAMKPRKRSINDTYTFGKESHPYTAESKLKSQRTAAKRCLFSEETPGPEVKVPRAKDDSAKGSEQLQMELKPMELEDETKPNKRGKGRKRRGRFKKSTSMSEGDSHLDKRASERQPSSKKRKGLKAITMPLRASKRLAALRDEQVATASVVETNLSDQLQENLAKENVRSEAPSNVDSEHSEKLKSKEPLGDQASPGKQVESSGVITDKADPEPPLSSLFADPLLDPCIEFALKTLTADIPDIPASDNNATFEGFFHQHLSPNKGPDTNCTVSPSTTSTKLGM
ncbi:uncharacterized protein LOC109707565 isoform X2 [Ananas comosus]|uniref:Uncharacterized protein LOC109707565 isoform X2 n=1 Tax=Ananas comosus TaxID=4615 RepID=A0A6P5ETJ5_ANACO|nr:uncharacterized protein LOC109707565 isoform X2 [Ananas comosus]